MAQTIIFNNNTEDALTEVIDQMNPASVFVLVDSNTSHFVLPTLKQNCPALVDAKVITIPAGDASKNLETVSTVYQALVQYGASRHSVLVNVGGGVVTDLGGFAASTFKRGIRFVNIPTTLLGAVDAAVGGKTGVNFMHLKNQVGVFNEAEYVIISTTHFHTLSHRELMSGYAEMLKHALLTSADEFSKLINFPIGDDDNGSDALLQLLQTSVQVKSDIVAADPHEAGIRKALNLGHTIGHAFESLALRRNSPIAHGYAVACGLVAETILSSLKEGFSSELLHALTEYVRNNYGAFAISCNDYPVLLDYMRQDKKNASPDKINFTLLKAPGQVVCDVTIDDDDIKAALDIYRSTMGLA